MNLVERVLFTLVKLLSADINPLLSPQSRVLLFNLWHTTSLERRIRSLEPSFWVAVDLGGILVRQRQSVQRVIDTGCAETSGLPAWRTFIIQLGEIETAGFLRRCFRAAAFGFGWLRGFFFAKESVAFGLFACGFGFLGFGVLSALPRKEYGLESQMHSNKYTMDGFFMTYFFALLLAPFCHCLSSSADFLESSTAFLFAAVSAFYIMPKKRDHH